MRNIATWLCPGHKFKRVGYSLVGMTYEKYVQCKACGMTIVILNLQRKYFYILSETPKAQYFERKKMTIRKKRNDRQKCQRIMALLEEDFN